MQKSLSRFLLLFLFSFAISLFSVAAYGSVWYVRSDAPFGGDGTSWATAFRSVQQAINAASSIYIICMSPEDAIWVKRGTYYLSSQIDVNKVVLIYGGFNGTETSLNQRDWKNNETIIDGQSNCRCFNIMSFCQIDGFTIRNGMASSAHGGGIYIDSDPIWCYLGYYLTPKIRNCTITHNTSDYNGGGIYDNESDPDISNCTFSHNTADIHGGGLYILRSDPTIENCTFSDNSADSGGGLKNWESSPTIEKCLFSGNHSTGAGSWGGGAICTDYLSYGSITNCVFYNNDSVSRGGALASHMGYPTITNCSFSGNEAAVISSPGGAIYVNTAHLDIKSCIFWDDTPDELNSSSAVDPFYVSYSDIDGGYSGPGSNNINLNPDFVAPGNLHLSFGSPCIDSGATSGPSDDIEGASRPQDGDGDGVAKFDMGAYEYPEPTITVTYPNGGEAWFVGETRSIRWTSQGVTGYVRIQISRDGGSTWYTIVSSTTNDGYQSWTVAGPGSTQCRIQVKSISYPSVSDMSNANFTIAKPALPCEGDFNGDGDVDGSDLAVFAKDFGRTDCINGPPCEGDFDKDYDVDGSDLAVFATDFGRIDCP